MEIYNAHVNQKTKSTKIKHNEWGNVIILRQKLNKMSIVQKTPVGAATTTSSFST